MVRLPVIVLGLVLAAVPGGATRVQQPADESLARRIRAGIQLDYQLQRHYAYIEQRRDVKISKLGRVTVGPLRSFEVYPSDRPGGTYKRLIAVDGKPLTAEEVARRDAEHEADLREAAAKDQTETARQRASRLEKVEEEQRHRAAMLEDAFKVFTATVVGRESIEGLPVLVAEVKPRPGARPTTREGNWMTHFAGRIWIAEADAQVVKVDMQAESDVTIGWGVIGRIHKGSRVRFARRRFDNVWLPAEVTYQASGRTLLFRTFEFAVTTTYSDYKRRETNQ